jgi:2-iminoacetate synthase ThiH
LTFDAIFALIRGAGKAPAERDSFYNILRTFPAAAEVTA